MINIVMVAFAAIVGIFAIVLLNVINAFNKRAEKQEEAQQTERDHWKAERKELIDRIQAGSFAELKQAEVRVIKAHKKDEAPVLNYSHLE